MGIKPRKVVIIGAGHVGSHVGSSLMMMNVVDELVFIDIDEKKAQAHALDLYDCVSSLNENISVKVSGYEECADADVVVISAEHSLFRAKNASRCLTIQWKFFRILYQSLKTAVLMV